MATKVKNAKKDQQVQAFESLPQWKQRVAIAQDVIASINAGVLKTRPQAYIAGKLPAKLAQKDVWKAVKPDEAEAVQRKCTACALGSMFLAKIKLGNQVHWGDLNVSHNEEIEVDVDSLFEHLLHYFSKKQICLIESAYEQHLRRFSDFGSYTHIVNRYPADDDEAQALKFGSRFQNHKDRLLAIMQNIVDHDGEFVPSVEYVIVTG